ncbi:helix-turn-helix domain-containing protein [Deinococcus indicus]|uniref:helix-turn-helix domain-containing protein n=1 Tax=Deinococcus indicus TaxID=223556 RepID=UPI0011784017
MATSNRIRELIARKGETLAQAAVAAGITEKTLRNAINGRPTHRSTRRLIAQHLGLPEVDIWITHANRDYYSNADLSPQQEPNHE